MKKKLTRFFFNQAMLLLLIILFVVMSFVSDRFLSSQNILNIIRQVTVVGIMACGMTIVIIGGGLDLSAASILSLCAVINTMVQPFGYLTAIIASVLVGILCGLINGYLIGKVGTNFIATTLGTQILFTAIALIVTKGKILWNRPERIFSYIGQENILGIPVLGYFLVIVLIVSYIILHKTIPGRRLFATGLNDKAALVSGINTSNIILGSYTINGLVIGLAAIAFTARIARVRVAAADFYLFDVITVVVLGGSMLSGGIGGIGKTAIGLVIFAILNNGMALLSIPYEFQQMTKGIILILAVLFDEFNRRKRLTFE